MQVPEIFYPEDGEELLVLERALASGNLSGKGALVPEYEAALASWFRSRHALGLSSGAAALTVALESLGIGEGDEVLLTPTCPMCTVFPIQATGAKVVFCDTQAGNFGMDLNDALTQIGPRTKAIVEVPMWGYPISARRVRELARDRNLALVFDLAHCHGTTFENEHLSEYCDVACFSTHNNKLLSTGEGGFLLTDRVDCYEKAVAYSRFGGLTGEDFGLNFKLGSLQAALGLHRLGKLNENVARRTANAAIICNALDNPNLTPLEVIEGGTANYYHLILKCRGDNRVLLDTMNRKGIPSDVFKYKVRAVYEYPVLRRWRRSCPRAEKMLSTITTVPVHPGLSADHLDYIVEALNSFQPSS